MEGSKVLAALEDLLELDAGSIGGTEQLVDLPGWDSITVVGFIAMAYETFGVTVPPNRLMQSQTTADLAKLVVDGRA